MERIHYIDDVKGVAILLMLFCHTNIDGVISDWVFAFHMPMFFIIGGWLQYYIHPHNLCAYGKFLRKRILQLGLPYFVFSLILVFYYDFLIIISGQDVNLLLSLFPVFTFQGIDSLWFIPCFLFAEILICYTLIYDLKILKYMRFFISVIIILYIIINTNNMPQIWWQRVLLKSGVAFVFMNIGYIVAKYDIINKLSILYAIILFIIFSYISICNGHVGIGGLCFQNGAMFFINATCLCICILSIFAIFFGGGKRNAVLEILSFYGINSIVVLCTNNLLIEIIRLIDHKFTHDILLTWGFIGSVSLFIILAILEVPLIYLANTKCGWLFGKIQKRCKLCIK